MIRSAGRLALLAGSLAALVVGCGGDDERSDVDVRDARLAAVIKDVEPIEAATSPTRPTSSARSPALPKRHRS
jgi:hypothetical protein